jgi:hypothetical protein
MKLVFRGYRWRKIMIDLDKLVGFARSGGRLVYAKVQAGLEVEGNSMIFQKLQIHTMRMYTKYLPVR